MSYVDPDYKTKKAFKEAVKAGVEHRPYSPAGLSHPAENGRETIEGPHYPKPHTWYASVNVLNGTVTSVS